jgi:diguanylate cyclase (GGDEF)-like protein
VTDFIARYGGDEFAVLLADCSADCAAAVIERLRRTLPEGISCCAGLAQWDGSSSAEELVGRADASLYEAKRGRADRAIQP